MRHFLTFCVAFVLMAFFSIFSTFIAEITDVLQMRNRNLSISFNTAGEELIMSWSPIQYPCVYKIETMSETTGYVPNAPRYHVLTEAETISASYIVPRAPIPTYYSISARGIFNEIFKTKAAMANPNFPIPPRPIPIFHYTKENPASSKPFLIWHTVPNAVCYELEILSAPPEYEGGTELSKLYHLDSTAKIYTNGYQADLKPYYKNYAVVYWRARALGLHKEPIGEFSNAEPIYIDEKIPEPNAPLINNFDFMNYELLPMYPVYNWIPNNGAVKFEVELISGSNSIWRKTTADLGSCYDDFRRTAGVYYWHVRGLDAENNPVGTWSRSEQFIVNDFGKGVTAAIFGDSISHGGGAVSYSPRSLEYSYATYIDFPVINLSRSGDTAHTALERFESDVLPFKPKNLIISTGANSLRDAGITADEIISDLTQIMNLCKRNNIRPIFLTLMPINPENIKYAFHTETDPHWHEKLITVNSFIKGTDYFIDIEPYFYDEAGNMNSRFCIDGIHPDLIGKMLIGEVINQNRHLFRDVAHR